MRQPFTGSFQAFAHRGGGLEAFENSYAAFEHAVMLGYRYIETDLQASRDGVLYIFHDDRLERCTNGTGSFHDHSAAELDKLQLKDGTPIPRLADALAAFPAVIFNVDVKADSGVQPMIRFCQQAADADRLALASFSTKRLHAIKQAVGRPVSLIGGQADIVRLKFGQWGLPLATPDILAAQVPPRHWGLAVVTRAFVRHCHERQIKVHVWTINTRPEMERLLDLGVDGICTDRPSLLKEILIERGLWTANGC